MRSNVHHRHRSNCEVQRELIEGLRSSGSDLSVPLRFLVRTFSNYNAQSPKDYDEWKLTHLQLWCLHRRQPVHRHNRDLPFTSPLTRFLILTCSIVPRRCTVGRSSCHRSGKNWLEILSGLSMPWHCPSRAFMVQATRGI